MGAEADGAAAPTPQPRRAYTCMVGDLWHVGHANHCKYGREHADMLVVGLVDDEAVASYKRPPIMTHDERIAEARTCRWVDEMIEHAPLITTLDFLRANHIDVVIEGEDHDDGLGAASPYMQKYYPNVWGSEIPIVIVKRTPGISTTMLIQRILERGTSALDVKDDIGSKNLSPAPKAQA